MENGLLYFPRLELLEWGNNLCDLAENTGTKYIYLYMNQVLLKTPPHKGSLR